MPASAAPRPILTEFKGGVARLIFNNPARHNAMSLEMWTEGAELLEAFGSDDTVRVILLTGAGSEAFVAGADISKFGDERASRKAVEAYDRAVARFQQVMRDLENRPSPGLMVSALAAVSPLPSNAIFGSARKNPVSRCPLRSSALDMPWMVFVACARSSALPSPLKFSSPPVGFRHRKP